jgi:uncharacterized protein (DUF305 family)
MRASIVVLATALALAACTQRSARDHDAATPRLPAALRGVPGGDADAEFVRMMIAHHEGAIAMAQAELRYGHNERLRRMAQEIIVTQQQEIVAMRLAIGQSLQPPADTPPTGDRAIGPSKEP